MRNGRGCMRAEIVELTEIHAGRSRTKIRAAGRLSGLHVTAVMMRSVAIPRAPLYIWEAAVLSMGMKERDRVKRGWAHRWPLESGHAVMGRKRPLLAMPPFIPRTATLPRRDAARARRRRRETSSLSVRRVNPRPRDLVFVKGKFRVADRVGDAARRDFLDVMGPHFDLIQDAYRTSGTPFSSQLPLFLDERRV